MTHVNEQEIMRTDDLIQQLSRQAGMKKKSSITFNQAMVTGITLSLVMAMVVVLGLSHARPDLLAVLTTWVFQFKVSTMTLLAGGSAVLVRMSGIPGASARPVLALLPGVALLFAGAIFDDTGFPFWGDGAFAAPLCVALIVAASLPGLIAIMAGLRRGTPTRPIFAGAVSGLLSGSLAALVYTIACVNDGPSFVAVWYVVAISITTLIGAVTGRHVLAW
ncbi:NrsF family protein [Bordetella muralis]|jgi:hypothetical protein|uniref:NrsF family protein n=1 Tax=Bordetella muralis TaxID=1649130 RepID=UPI0039EF8FE8